MAVRTTMPSQTATTSTRTRSTARRSGYRDRALRSTIPPLSRFSPKRSAFPVRGMTCSSVLGASLNPPVHADEQIQRTCLDWLSQFLQFVPGVLVPFVPRLIPVILSALAHHVPEIEHVAQNTNDLLFAVVQSLPVDPPGASLSPSVTQPALAQSHPHGPDRTSPASPPPSSIPFPSTSATTPRPGHDRHKPGSDAGAHLQHHASATALSSINTATSTLTISPPSADSDLAPPPDLTDPYEPDGRQFQYGLTVNELTLQFLSDSEETRVAALEWLLMLHQKAPRKVSAQA